MHSNFIAELLAADDEDGVAEWIDGLMDCWILGRPPNWRLMVDGRWLRSHGNKYALARLQESSGSSAPLRRACRRKKRLLSNRVRDRSGS